MDERYYKPSASRMERLSLCPGSGAAEATIPEQKSNDAETGTLIHGAIAALLTGDTIPNEDMLSQDDLDLARRCVRETNELLEKLNFYVETQHVEVRLWYRDQWSGKPDVFFIDHVKLSAVIIDYKTGRSATAKASENLQLRALAVLVSMAFNVENVVTCIVQPLSETDQISMASYDICALEEAEQQILAIIEASQKFNAPRIPGPVQCKYCKAKSACREHESWCKVGLPTVPEQNSAVGTWTPAGWASFLAWEPMARQWLESKREEAMVKLRNNPDAIPGFRLVEHKRRTVTSALDVYQRAATQGVSGDAFSSECSISLSALRKLLREATALKGRALDEAVSSCVEDCVKVTTYHTIEEE